MEKNIWDYIIIIIACLIGYLSIVILYLITTLIIFGNAFFTQFSTTSSFFQKLDDSKSGAFHASLIHRRKGKPGLAEKREKAEKGEK